MHRSLFITGSIYSAVSYVLFADETRLNLT
jgi:hypothetical protein